MNHPQRSLTRRKMLRAALLSFVAAALSAHAAPPPDIQVDVDAREISRSLLHARLEIPAAPGEFIVWYPKWVPGVHSPAGPVQNLAGLRFETAAGVPIAWRRDDDELHRFHLTVPAGADRVIAKLDYICNQTMSGVDCFGSSLLGVINWNTVLLYPEGVSIDTATAAVRLTLPDGWQHGSSLTTAKSEGAVTAFQPMTLGERDRQIVADK